MPRRWMWKCNWRGKNTRNCDQDGGIVDLLGGIEAKEKLGRKG